MAKLLYSTSFADATPRDANRLNMGIENWIGTAGTGYYALDHTFGHSDNHSLLLHCPAGTGVRRSEFDIQGFDRLGNPSLTFPTNECYVSVWQYLPVDWQLNGTEYSWYSICNPYNCYGNGGWNPRAELHIIRPKGTEDHYYLDMGYSEPPYTLGRIDPYEPLTGKWFHFEWWIYLHETEGQLKFWINGVLAFEATNIRTRLYNSTYGYWWMIAPGKVYTDDEGGTGATNDLKLWIDDIEIWDGMPTEMPPAPIMHTLTIGQSTGGSTTPAAGAYEYAEGTMITLTAMPDEGYQFTRWTSPDESAGGITPVINWIMHRDITLTAEFAPIVVKPCFIATAAYGSPLVDQLNTFRAFRDKSLPDRLVNAYYRASPPLANWIARHRHARSYVRRSLDILERILRRDSTK